MALSSPAVPIISIGLPVYNGEKDLPACLDALLGQSFDQFELIISDNASTDRTEAICREYAERDSRIRYVRQPENNGPLRNFRFVFDVAQAEYFMWAGCDDFWSSDFLKHNHVFLACNPDYVASTSPNGFENWSRDHDLVDFALDGEQHDRYVCFLQRSFLSHGMFYSLFRTKVLRECETLDQIFPGFDWLGFDWAIILYLASKGKIHRTSSGHMTFGVNGASSSANVYRKFNTSAIEWLLPLYRISKFTVALVRPLPLRQRAQIFLYLVRLNLYANLALLRQWMSPLFFGVYSIVRPLWKRLKRH